MNCAVCGRAQNLEKHHIRHWILEGKGRLNSPNIARKDAETVVLCRVCHARCHAGYIDFMPRSGGGWLWSETSPWKPVGL